jgi:energy coupling factor transporter S component ThiW
MKQVQLVARMGVLVALGVVLSIFPIFVFGAKLAPAQAAVNVVAGVLIGPWYAAAVALMTALLRIGLHLGTPLAIPGSIFGAVLAGLFYRLTKSRIAAMAGEVIGTGLIGALVAYPIALYLMGSAAAAAASVYYLIIPFTLSSLTGALLGGAVLPVLQRILPK